MTFNWVAALVAVWLLVVSGFAAVGIAILGTFLDEKLGTRRGLIAYCAIFLTAAALVAGFVVR